MPAEFLGDREEGFEMTWEEWINTEIGPRVVGGHYDHGDDASAYEVLAIERGPRPTWPIWQITVRSASGRVHTHCSRWNSRRDRERGTEPSSASAPTIHCPRDGASAEEYQVRNPDTGDVFDRARCTHCGHSWALDPGADASCRACGGSGEPGAPRLTALRTPLCECVGTAGT